jgi:cell division protein FtsB
LFQYFKILPKLAIFVETLTKKKQKFMKMTDILEKIRDAYHGPRRKFVWFVTLSTAVFLFVWIVGPGNTVIHWIGAGVETRRQERQIEQYRQQNSEMETRLNMLRNDKDTLEKFAREQFRFAVPGEDVYIVE